MLYKLLKIVLPFKKPTVCGDWVEQGTPNKIMLQNVSQLLLPRW